jgi:hypothetical protein
MRNLLSLILFVALGACTLPSGAEVWSLEALAIEPQFVANRGTLPIWRRGDLSPSGDELRACGRIETTSQGHMLVEVTITEKALSLGGRERVMTWPVFAFAGRIEGSKVVQDDAGSARAPLGVPTRLETSRSGDVMKVWGFTGDRPLPYIATFRRGAQRQSAVFVPTLN